MRTYYKVDFVDVPTAGRIRSGAGQPITDSIGIRLRSLDACHISHGTKEALAIPLEGKKRKSPAESCCSTLFHSDSRAPIEALGECSAQEGPTSVAIATQVSVGWTC
jgi:hypothetical protein